MTLFRATAALQVAMATIAAGFVGVGIGVGPWQLARWLGEYGGPEYPLWIGWTLFAPAVLVAAARAERRTPWPWVVASTVQVLALALALARFAHLAPWWAWLSLAAVTGAGVLSIGALGTAGVHRSAPG